MKSMEEATSPHVALLTAGRDHPYAFGMGTALMAAGICVDIIGADDLDHPQWYNNAHVRFLNMRGDLSTTASFSKKVTRVLAYYTRLLWYALTTRANLFHILWNNKFETFDRIPLMLFYKFCGKATLLTVHNVNARERDSTDSWWNRLTLRGQYRLADHLFVHADQMKKELVESYGVSPQKISVIPFGINNAVPNTALLPSEARQRLGISMKERTILFFGNIAPYKGLEYLIEAFHLVISKGGDYRLIIAGNPKNCDSYWDKIRETIEQHQSRDQVLERIKFIPDAETEMYFKAADILVLPYKHVYQSGVLFLGYSFGLPVIATDVGGLREGIVEGRTGWVCKPEDAEALARAIETYFASDLYHNLESRRSEIQQYALERHSWSIVTRLTVSVYRQLLSGQRQEKSFVST